MPTREGATSEIVHVKATVINHYRQINDEVPSVAEADLPVPPKPLALGPDLSYRWPLDVLKWINEELFRMTGIGRAKGDVIYVLEVIESSRPDLVPVGLTWEWEC